MRALAWMPMLRRANLYDGDKIGVFPPNPDDRAMLRREDGQRDYWDRER